ncbi:hypothetical protein Zm00014a_018360 [Zea mays]|uniref:Uncharacterized protein n=1 Tax=Zea mays TaxID=4577 RepID=A0A3L6G756_MAIZE|nr:hypothetical protein Zm00014a_018360 [Zea mays]
MFATTLVSTNKFLLIGFFIFPWKIGNPMKKTCP